MIGQNKFSILFGIGIVSILEISGLFGNGKKIYLTPIQGTIDMGLAPYVSRVIQEAEANGAQAIVFEIDTFGGRVDAATEIKDAIFDAKIQTIAYVNKRAISAGALISLSCTKIVMAPGSTIGAATAVDLEGKKASEKVISYFRSEMRATAEKNGRNGKIAEAMVDEDVVVDSINTKGKLITLTADDAIRYRMADYIVNSLEEVLSRFDLSGAEIIRTDENWAEDLVRFLTDPIVSSILLSIGILGLIFEVKSPGWGVGGTMAVIFLALFFGSRFLVNLAGWGDLILFLIGLTLLIVEIFFIPGFGVAGVLGILFIIISIFSALIGQFRTATKETVVQGTYIITSAFLGATLLALLLAKYVPKTAAWNRLTLPTEEKTERGFRSSRDYSGLLGKEGEALSVLRPAGQAQVGEDRIDVVSEGEFLPAGSKIRVVKVEGNRVIVRKAEI